MLLQTNSYIVPQERRAEHARLIRRFRQALNRLGCDQFEVYEQVGANWSPGGSNGRYVQIMRFRDRQHQQAVQAAERADAGSQQIIAEFCDLINFPYQQQHGYFATGFYLSVLPVGPRQMEYQPAAAVEEAYAEGEAPEEDAEAVEAEEQPAEEAVEEPVDEQGEEQVEGEAEEQLEAPRQEPDIAGAQVEEPVGNSTATTEVQVEEPVENSTVEAEAETGFEEPAPVETQQVASESAPTESAGLELEPTAPVQPGALHSSDNAAEMEVVESLAVASNPAAPAPEALVEPSPYEPELAEPSEPTSANEPAAAESTVPVVEPWESAAPLGRAEAFLDTLTEEDVTPNDNVVAPAPSDGSFHVEPHEAAAAEPAVAAEDDYFWAAELETSEQTPAEDAPVASEPQAPPLFNDQTYTPAPALTEEEKASLEPTFDSTSLKPVVDAPVAPPLDAPVAATPAYAAASHDEDDMGLIFDDEPLEEPDLLDNLEADIAAAEQGAQPTPSGRLHEDPAPASPVSSPAQRSIAPSEPALGMARNPSGNGDDLFDSLLDDGHLSGETPAAIPGRDAVPAESEAALLDFEDFLRDLENPSAEKGR